MYNNEVLAYQRLTQALVDMTSLCKTCISSVPESKCGAMTAQVQRWVPNMLAFFSFSFAYGRCTAEHKLKVAKAPALLTFFAM